MSLTTSPYEKFILLLGALLILLALVVNEWTIARLLCPEAIIEQRYKVNIRILEVLLLLAGLAMIFFRKKEVTINLSVLALTLIGIFSITEITFRLFFPQIAGVSEHQRLFEYDQELGWRFIPRKTGVYLSKHEFKTNVTINSAGMRDIEYTQAKPAGKKRIVLLGDSFTSSMGVDLFETFSKIMEEKLLTKTQVLNFGVNGYGPTQELMLLQKSAISYQPDLVIMVVYLGNDFDDISGVTDGLDGYNRPRAVTDEKGHLLFTGIPVPLSERHRSGGQTPHTCSMPRSHFIDFIDKTIYLRTNAPDFKPPEVRLCRKKADPRTEESYRLMGAILKETNNYCKKKGISFVVAVAPAIVQVYDQIYWTKMKNKYHLRDADYDLMLPNKKIMDVCKSAGIPAVDLTYGLKKAVAAGRDTYYFINLHWNKAGEQTVAEILSDFITEKKLL